MSNTNNARKARVTSDDVVMAYLLEGSGVVKTMLIEHTNAADVLSKAITKIRSKNEHQDVTDLLDMRRAALASRGTGQRGASPLAWGTSKVYSTQQVGEEGDLFIRLPVGLLVDHKGAQVKVEALDDGTFRIVRA